MTKITKSRGYAIGEMSKLTSVNIETIRYYERIELMPKPGRTAGGNRQYSHEHLKQLFFIKRSRDLGFSTREIRALLGMALDHSFTCAEVHDLSLNHLVSVRGKISALHKLEATLEGMVAECSNGDIPACPILDTLFETS